MRVDLFDFELPPDRIALRPAEPRDAARMLLVDGPTHRRPRRPRPARIAAPRRLLVFNDTRVIPAQLEGRRGDARIGATLHKRHGLRRWRAFVRNAKRLRRRRPIDFAAGVSAIGGARNADGSCPARISHGEEPVEVLLERAGRMPLPPYIAGKRAADDARPRATTRRCSRARRAPSPRRPPRCTSRPS